MIPARSMVRANPNACPGVGCILTACASCQLWHCPVCGCQIEPKEAS